MNNSESKKAHNKKVKTTKLSDLTEPSNKLPEVRVTQDDDEPKVESIPVMLAQTSLPTKTQPRAPSDLAYIKVSSNGSKKYDHLTRLKEYLTKTTDRLKTEKRIGLFAEDKTVEKLVNLVEQLKKEFPGIEVDYYLEYLQKNLIETCSVHSVMKIE